MLCSLVFVWSLADAFAFQAVHHHLPICGCLSLLRPYLGAGGYHFKGYIDEFRVWRGRRSLDDIRARMYTRADPSDPTLMVYYDFDEKIIDETVTDATQNAVIGVQDRSTYKVDLMFGACTPNTPKFCWNSAVNGSSDPCTDSSVPLRNCWQPSTRQDSAMPLVVESKAPIGSLPVTGGRSIADNRYTSSLCTYVLDE